MTLFDPQLVVLAGSVLVASLVGSPHCAAMCGGFVCLYSVRGARADARAHLAYHGGRLMSYVSLGAIAGALGTGLDRLGAGAGLPRGAALAAGIALLAWGTVALLRALGVRVALPARLAPLGVPIAGAMRAVHAQPPVVRAATLGLVTTLLPCGWLYLYVATAAGTGTPLAGAALMAVFWLGTVPVLAGLGVVAQRTLEPLRRRLPALSAIVLIAAGALTISGRVHRVCVACRVQPPVAAAGAEHHVGR